MKKISILLMFCALFTLPLFSQITITTADLSNYLITGRVFSTREDTTSTSCNIGGTGSTSFNFASLNFNLLSADTIMSPAATGYAGYFPSATHAIHAQGYLGTDLLDFYTFYVSGNDAVMLGLVLHGNLGGTDFLNISKFLSQRLLIKVPATLNSTWGSDYIDSTYLYFNGVLQSAKKTHEVIENTIDGYGPMTLPGNRVVQALRVKMDRRTTSSPGYSREITYQFYGKDLESISITAADSLQPNTGTINASYITWALSNSPNSIATDHIVKEFLLNQNYPNPFNPSTEIEYNLPFESNVNLTVYNSLGQAVTELVSGVQSQGVHQVHYNGANLSSGIYYYKITGLSTDGKNNFISTKKMTLLK